MDKITCHLTDIRHVCIQKLPLPYMLGLRGYSWSGIKLLEWLDRQPAALKHVAIDRDFILPDSARPAYLSTPDNLSFVSYIVGTIASEPLFNLVGGVQPCHNVRLAPKQFTDTWTVNLRCPVWIGPEAHRVFDAQISKLHDIATAMTSKDPVKVHELDMLQPFNVLRWTSAKAQEKWTTDDPYVLRTTTVDTHIVAELSVGSMIECSSARARVVTRRIVQDTLTTGSAVILQVYVHHARFNLSDTPLRGLVEWIQGHTSALLNSRAGIDFTIPDPNFAGYIRHPHHIQHFKCLVFGLVSEEPYRDPYSGIETINIEMPRWELPAAQIAFQSQVAKLRDIAAQIASTDAIVVHVELPIPFNDARWTSTSSTARWMTDDLDQLRRSPPDDHIVIELTSGTEQTGTDQQSVASGAEVVVELSMFHRRFFQNDTPIRHMRLLARRITVFNS
ncbi:hypothetical protein C8J57DRAFT_1257578 [Mycena rebaudengoi]|nr:hypothetical protein C8J57DRAFT_1257578 [Mycena rebaudengoi]